MDINNIPNGTMVLFRKPRCKCVGGGWTEQIGRVVDRLIPPNGKLWYKIEVQYHGILVVPTENILGESK